MKITLTTMILSIVFSGVFPAEYLTWAMEVAPICIAMPFVYYYGKYASVSTPLLICIAIHSVILAIGAHYTYANVPMGNWFIQMGVFERNNYDKIGHFIQGVTPALLLTEILIRKQVGLENRYFMKVITVFVSAGFSAMFEIIEWFSAIILGSGADNFLGTQGYIWDTQSDMLMAILGATFSVLLLTRYISNSINRAKFP